MSCDVREAAIGLERVILQPLHCFSYVTAHSPTLPSLHLHHSSFSNPSVASPTSQVILQPFRRFTYITAHSPTFPSLHLHHSSFYNPSVASPTSLAKLPMNPRKSHYDRTEGITQTYNYSEFKLVGSRVIKAKFSLCRAGAHNIYIWETYNVSYPRCSHFQLH